MNEEKMLKIVQEQADKSAQDFIFKRSAKLELIHSEKINGVNEVYVLGSDMPNLIYRIFYVKEDGSCQEENDMQKVVEKSNHYKYEIQPKEEKVPPAVCETQDYEIILENKIENGGVEVKLKSSVNRDITMVETYRYFDYVSKIFFTSCISLSFGGQYLFTVTPDGKHLRLMLGRDEAINKRLDMISELLTVRMLPSYQTVTDGHNALTNPNAKAIISLHNSESNKDVKFVSNFSYDDLESGNMFSFFTQEDDPKNGLIFIQDVLDGSLTLSDKWNEDQRNAAERVRVLMQENPTKFNENAHNYFADSLDLRYKAYKDGRRPQISPETQAPGTEANN